MSDIAPIGRSNPAAYTRSSRSGGVNGSSNTGFTRGSDQVQLSDAARYLSALKQLPDVRQELIDRVKEEIAQGGYDSDEKFDAILNSVAEDLA